MRLVVDSTRCQGYGQCVFAAPEVFRMPGDEALLYEPNPSDEQREKVLRAAAACPTRAIVLDHRADEAAIAQRRAATTAGVVERIVVVGASLAGLRAAYALRREGFGGSLTVIGDETHGPYDRVPLSKQVLAGWVPAQDTALPRSGGLDADWRLGQAAVGLDRRGKRVVLAGGDEVAYDRLLIATGVRARPWPNPDEAALTGVYTVRNRDDALGLRQRLAAEPRQVLVIGAGFIGSEVASNCRELGIPVTVVDHGPAPLAGALGAAVGRIAAEMQREAGVDLRCTTSVSALEGDAEGRLRRARLSDGTTLDVDVAVAALGAQRNVEWLQGAGLASGPWGVACDAGCRAFDANGVVTDDIFVAGDVARFPHPAYEYQFMALEHWGNAVDQAEIAAHNMVGTGPDRWAHVALPVFWSTQFGTEIKSIGVPTFADEIVVAQGSTAERRFVAVYGRQGRITAAVTFDQGMWLEHYGRLIAQAAPFPPQARTVDEPPSRHPVPAEIRQAPSFHATVVLTGHQPSERTAVLVPVG
ncbi:FAD-dependent oxidoreductase [Dactylosporangium sp. AC04546]|uniref:FAD-dependent oxidoreductase n=1 Tax=Dactylosporangium sp. AC04546 TaxID=2862460 RepID=UPI001EE04C3B|nr:FAD-dependent oxidoreductase [Dactylosporangium sp. AC04546]WVK79545.1 FAD-dependent oxidoreductase [Dactylosporangium sp. AC04546]